MVKETESWIPLVALGLAVLAIVLVLNTGGESTFVINSESTNALTVSGDGELAVEPDKVEIYVRIETESDVAVDAQKENRVIADRVMSAVKKLGIRNDDVETTQYRLEKIQEWNSRLQTTEFRGYRLYHVMRVTTENLDKTGEIIDASVEAGANRVDSIQFGLTDKTMRKAKEDVLELAAKNAEEKAKSLAKTLDVKMGKPIRISESNYDIYPVYKEARSFALSVSDESAPPTQVSADDVEIKASVSVSYEIN